MRASLFIPLCFSGVASAASFNNYHHAATERPNCPPRSVSSSEQRAIFNDFVKDFYVEKNTTKALLNHMTEDYIQHNPRVLSGRQSSVDFLATLVTPDGVNMTIIHNSFDNNIGYIHYRLDTLGAPQPTAIVDVFRFEGSCIMEHWDVIQDRPANATNPLAMF
ncbi:snoal-like polyketide cyclase family protein [Colletotrichum truncatum]|uniref:Snoal-like polyketide cyclase family protein n=1 Tax=Colletotrichum truncatum TaxID=5467 RepID=A0ACC3YW97_COLTU|nr:snoal-like polyketide cyclase family protein [Colletotrichum truncatum]XP_036582394.1 snoal-like polyketide cyclase family protein [Colletotrichum truncatum]KAF6780733.1 snoal-like polyketide cyclase family protein [Colletotrichum truncatum]KAF6791098.1 snoal-like polyketide cyclase family protein [Colletotrichum truncatum]